MEFKLKFSVNGRALSLESSVREIAPLSADELKELSDWIGKNKGIRIIKTQTFDEDYSEPEEIEITYEILDEKIAAIFALRWL